MECVGLVVERLKDAQEAADRQGVPAALRGVEQPQVAAFTLQAHVFGGNDADSEAVDVGDATKVEQDLQSGLIEQLVMCARRTAAPS